MKLLVTGSAGFIGSSFVRMLLGQGFDAKKNYPWSDFAHVSKIISLDLLTYAASQDNLDAVKGDARHVFVKGDILDSTLVTRLVKEHQLDAIVNFAAESHVDRSILGSAPFVNTNVMGTVKLLDVCKELKLKFLQVSTDEVYGSLGDQGAFTEASPILPNSPYSASKAAADAFVRAYVETHHVWAVTTRCTNNYGPFQFPEKFLPLTMTRLMTGGKIPVYGTGKNVRDWIHVEDHCYGIWLALRQGKSGEVYNFGGYGERTNLDMAKALCKMAGADEAKTITFVEDRKGHDWRYAMDPAKVSRELKWAPQWKLDEGLAHMFDWYQTHKAWWEAKKQ